MQPSAVSETIEWNWRNYFTRNVISLAEEDVRHGKIVNFILDPAGHWAQAETVNGFRVAIKDVPVSMAEYRKYPSIGPGGRVPFCHYFSCTCSQYAMGIHCRHIAALLTFWENRTGVFTIRETPAERERRTHRALEERARKEKEKTVFRLSDYLKEHMRRLRDTLYFQPDRIAEKSAYGVNQYEAELAGELLEQNIRFPLSYSVSFHPGHDRQILQARSSVELETVSLDMDQREILGAACSCGRCIERDRYAYYVRNELSTLCCHALLLFLRLRDEIAADNPGDDTDYHANSLLEMLSGKVAEEKELENVPESAVREKKATVELIPRLRRSNRDGEKLQLSFDLSRAGGKSLAVRSLEDLVRASEQEEKYSLGKTLSVDFAEETFTESAQKWYQMIESRVHAVRQVNARLNGGYRYYSPEISAGNGIPLESSDLDTVWDMTEGTALTYQYGTKTESRPVLVRNAHPRAEVRLNPVLRNDDLISITLTGTLPRILKGSRFSYILDDTQFGRVSDAELRLLEPFRRISPDHVNFRCVLGEKKFAEFYYRILPALQESDQITLIDGVGPRIEGLLPPEGEFTFYVDIAGDSVTCTARVRYAEREYTLGRTLSHARGRDADQEARVMETVCRFFPQPAEDTDAFCAPNTEEQLVSILTDGVAALSAFGTVNGSDAFRRVHVRPAPEAAISVQVEGGLLDLTVKTRDLSEEDLLQLLSSYRMKKRWHRLKNGDFVDLRGADSLREIDDAAEAMDLRLEELLHGGVRLPKYRALYIDKMLEAHNALAASRDRQFNSLIRAFQTIRDSDFEVPGSLSDTLRPYQLYGFRWLSTLSQAGFGGILADEMGLGKTVQALAFLKAQRDGGERRPALVVCPASLVYNWKEECRRFTPDLPVRTVDGTLTQRKSLLKALRTQEAAALYITSYDLLKRDITLYDGFTFSTVILDEAQYIKNRNAAISKAVRVLKSDRRFALTGTPIENRLSELWSIFDFLMPGFLYTSSEFTERFETPITRQKNQAAAEKLSRMTEPFILRRKKTDVLRDLPEKIEETRSSAMEEDQRRLYDAQVVHMRSLINASSDSGEDKMRILAEITRLRQLCCDPSLLFSDYRGSSAKRAACLELVQSAIDGGHRMLLFSQFTSMLSLLAEDLKRENIPFYTITGATPKQERLRLVNEFNAGDVPVFLVSLKAGGTGLNLTGADLVIHYDPWWNLAVQNQATDRAHRIGQTRRVTVVRLIAAETIEEKIIELQEAKRELADAIISGQNTSLMSLSREELLELIG